MTMTPGEIIQNLNFALTASGVIFGIYLYFRNPQINSDKKESILEIQVKQLNVDLINLRDNHIHTLDTKIDGVQKEVNQMNINIGKLETIIDERIPKKT